jgi:hypothetical protein
LKKFRGVFIKIWGSDYFLEFLELFSKGKGIENKRIRKVIIE